VEEGVIKGKGGEVREFRGEWNHVASEAWDNLGR
jgi:hypothetical protein